MQFTNPCFSVCIRSDNSVEQGPVVLVFGAYEDKEGAGGKCRFVSALEAEFLWRRTRSSYARLC